MVIQALTGSLYRKEKKKILHHFYCQTERIFTGESLAAVVGKGKAMHVA